jgi:hypothetical protein
MVCGRVTETRRRNMPETKVVNVKTDQYDVYIGRFHKYGGPSLWSPLLISAYKYRKGMLKKYYDYVKHGILQGKTCGGVKYSAEEYMNELLKLDGKILGCHCKPKACHGDVLVRLIEELKTGEVNHE